MQEILRSATFNDVPEIRSLWIASFFDSDAYLDLFFENRFDPRYTVLYCFDKEIAAMVHLLPCEVKGRGKAFYWYAVCVKPKYRGKHIFKKMSKKVLSVLQEKGYISVCKPVPGLEDLYKNIGFSYAFYAKDYKIFRTSRDTHENAEIREAMSMDFQKIDYANGSLIWRQNDIKYAIDENDFCGGKSFKIFANGGEARALAILTEHGWFLDSTDLTVDFAKKFNVFICDYLKSDFFYLRKPAMPDETNSFISGLCDRPVVNPHSNLFFTLW